LSSKPEGRLEKLKEIDEIFLRLLDDPPREVISFFFFLEHSEGVR